MFAQIPHSYLMKIHKYLWIKCGWSSWIDTRKGCDCLIIKWSGTWVCQALGLTHWPCWYIVINLGWHWFGDELMPDSTRPLPEPIMSYHYWFICTSTLVQVMAWCLMASSHYLDQCWHIISGFLSHISGFLSHYLRTVSQEMVQDSKISFTNHKKKCSRKSHIWYHSNSYKELLKVNCDL